MASPALHSTSNVDKYESWNETPVNDLDPETYENDRGEPISIMPQYPHNVVNANGKVQVCWDAQVPGYTAIHWD